MYKLSYSIEDGTLSFCDFTIYLAMATCKRLSAQRVRDLLFQSEKKQDTCVQNVM